MGTTITVFGGTGFLGRRIVSALARRGVTVRPAARHPERGTEAGAAIVPVVADVTSASSVARAVAGASAAVNAVSLYDERGGLTFDAIHVAGARRVAEAARSAGVERLVHLSGIGADASAASRYVSARGLGEAAVRAAFPDATIIRPSAMFGPDDAFLTALLGLTRLPVIPLFGRGRTRLQPVHVEDVAEAAARILTAETTPAPLWEFGGPQTWSYRDLVREALRATGRRRPLLPVPLALWDALAVLARALPTPPITEGQVALMRRDNVADAGLPGLPALGVEPRPVAGELRCRLDRS